MYSWNGYPGKREMAYSPCDEIKRAAYATPQVSGSIPYPGRMNGSLEMKTMARTTRKSTELLSCIALDLIRTTKESMDLSNLSLIILKNREDWRRLEVKVRFFVSPVEVFSDKYTLIIVSYAYIPFKLKGWYSARGNFLICGSCIAINSKVVEDRPITSTKYVLQASITSIHMGNKESQPEDLK